MRNLLYICFIGLIALSCDDGDIFEVSLEFDDVALETCGNLVFFKEKDSPPETLSIQISNRTFEQMLAVDVNNIFSETYMFSASTNSFNYRTYSSIPDNVFCNDVPPANLNITSDAESTSGQADLTTILIEDDNDGIPAEFEDLNGNGNLDDDDTDLDGIPNYLDVDDDGDNVYTALEEVNYTAIDGFSNALDTDNDGVPNYLDNDDDGDTVLTRDEENITQDNNPQNDVLDPNVGADYLNFDVNTSVPATEYKEHIIQQQYTITIDIQNIQLPNLTQQAFSFGELTASSTRLGEPVFN
ncbi:hypothetical protein ES692_02285 [Psychroserpens burtonensis]|uniref:Uncharacterized protein n=1 Tax=Psychroserpens burtonensis TaxID=49278 RepID=A0A5C7BBW2_9FLAO|nr:hypothetical protein [Psychroserpens burtonensis]TXE19601.1 hypothetical protein ES692_02285 [Psychroserpens burtonensis]